MQTKIDTTIKALGSRWMFYGTALLFTLQTSWLAVTSRFPMPFDEAYHLGLIQFFSHRWNPIVTTQPPDSYRFGAIAQGPSWLYHYLMSFPYRLMELFTSSLPTQVIGLRFIDIAFMVAGLFILRKLLRLVRLSDALANTVVLIFALTPMVTVLSAQISYDDLFFLLTTLCVYEAVLLRRELDEKSFNSRRFLGLLCLCLLASLVKFAFLPILVAITAVVAWKLIVYWKTDRTRLLNQASGSFASSNSFIKVSLLLATTLSIFLFVRFYGVNTVVYHNPVPQCNQLLSKKDCLHYYSWYLNYNTQRYTRTHPASATHLSVGQFASGWMLSMSEHLYGAVTPLGGSFYISPWLYYGVLLLLAVSFDCAVVNFRKIIRGHPELLMLLFISLVYALFLWGRNYWDYLQLGQPLAVNGKYLIPILAYFYAILGVGVSRALRSGRSASRIKVVLAIIIIGMFIGFGGFMQYITRVTPSYGHLNKTNDFVLNFNSNP